MQVDRFAFLRNFYSSIPWGNEVLSLNVVHNARARRYLLRIKSDLSVRLTIPRGGSLAEAEDFLDRNKAWLERNATRLAARPKLPEEWFIGTMIPWRGELVPIEHPQPFIRFGSESLKLGQVRNETDLRGPIERHIWRVARRELPPVVHAYAQQHGLAVTKVTVRNQRSRWGSCSQSGAISLNWRLLQAPVFVRDYLILHELMHLREMNHSRRFWAHVASVCPDYKEAERWLSQHSHLLQ